MDCLRKQNVRMSMKQKKINTVLTIKMMGGKTVRDVFTDFFGEFPEKIRNTSIEVRVNLSGISVPYEVYKMLSGYGASKELLDSFEFKYITSNVIDGNKLVGKLLELCPFNNPDSIESEIQSWRLFLDPKQRCFFRIAILTSTSSRDITEEQLKAVNKENARNLRKRFVSLPSVQCALYECEYEEHDIAEEKCRV